MKYTLREILETNKGFKTRLIIDWCRDGQQFEQTHYPSLEKALIVIPTKQLDDIVLSNKYYMGNVEYLEVEYQE